MGVGGCTSAESLKVITGCEFVTLLTLHDFSLPSRYSYFS